jgi:integrase
MKLTAAIVPTLACPPDRKDKTYFDDLLPGFGLRCRASGVRRWVCMYEMNGHVRRVTIGSPEVLGLDQARKVARKTLAEKALGRDPAAQKAQDRRAAKHALGGVIADYLKHCETRLRPASMRHLNRYLRDWWKPLASMPISRITRRDIAPYLAGPPVAAARARSRLRTCCQWAIEQGYLDSNPVIGSTVPDKHVRPRSRVLSLDELAAIWKACGEDAYGTIVKLLIVTAARRAEVGDMRWRELDNGLWTIPAARAKSGRDHVLLLPPLAWRLIDEWSRRGAGPDWLFWGHGFRGWSRSKRALDATSGVQGHVLHDIRRSVATHMADAGVSPHVVEAVLGHAHGSAVARVYNRAAYLNDMRVALAMWADRLVALVDGAERRIIPIRSQDSLA